MNNTVSIVLLIVIAIFAVIETMIIVAVQHVARKSKSLNVVSLPLLMN